ncbi:MFS transporter [Bacillus sp. 31A1R]|uniref:MFS transporter n=1 Tax=Robertmurraya mangrovi TaxID=3098077 RepID=A0ABU5IW34_9BACI|nr:MFS transporter [Bacillus sp. 31A1R]MDZ5471359.1 MFS transporter [Bacillus sp. 31A1R]
MSVVNKEILATHSQPSIWNNKNFLILLFSGTIIAVGSKVYELALPLFLYELTQSSVTMSTMRGIEFLPNLLFALIIGVIVDRVNKKRWSLWMTALQALILAILYSLIELGIQPIFLFYLSGFLLMTCSYGYFNARFSMVKQVLPNELLTPANASFSFVTTFVGIMGPALTGMILMMSDIHQGFIFTSAAFLISFVSMMFLDHHEEIDRKDTNLWEDLKEGWRELRKNRPLWFMTILVIFINSTTGMVDAVVIFFAKDDLQLSNSEVGLVLSCAGLGGLVGSGLVTRLRKNWSIGYLLGWSIPFTSLAFLLMFLSNNLYVLGFALFLEGVFLTIFSVCIWTFRQETTPVHLMGRISGITGSMFKLGMPFAIFSAGWVADWLEPSWLFLAASIFNILIFAFFVKSPLWHYK